MLRATAMTIGQLAQRTGVSIKVLRAYEQLGFLYTLGRSAGNYRLFSEETLWCVQLIQRLRALGLTLKAIQEILTRYGTQPDSSMDLLLADHLAQTLARINAQIATLQEQRHRLLAVQAAQMGGPSLPATADLMRLLAADPRRCDPRS